MDMTYIIMDTLPKFTKDSSANDDYLVFDDNACKDCPNNSQNGGNRICNCTLGWPQITC
jgi:hypothetical protein